MLARSCCTGGQVNAAVIRAWNNMVPIRLRQEEDAFWRASVRGKVVSRCSWCTSLPLGRDHLQSVVVWEGRESSCPSNPVDSVAKTPLRGSSEPPKPLQVTNADPLSHCPLGTDFRSGPLNTGASRGCAYPTVSLHEKEALSQKSLQTTRKPEQLMLGIVVSSTCYIAFFTA